MQMQGRATHHFDGVKIVRHQGAGISAPDRQLSSLAQLPFTGGGSVVDALIEDIVFVPEYAANHGPGRVVVRRLRVSGQSSRGIEGEAPVAVLAEPIDGGRLAGRDRKMLGGKQVTLGREADHDALDALERVPSGAVARLQRFRFRYGRSYGGRASAHDGYR